jgi:CHAD domain-containing protein
MRCALRHALRPENQADRTEDIHQVRVHCKRLRALLRLLKPVSDPAIIERENTRLREAARALATFRDAFVAGETLKRVFEDTAPRRMKQVSVLLGVKNARPKRRGDLTMAFDHLATALRHAAAAVRALPLKARGWDALAPGLERSYARACAAFQKCQQGGHRRRYGERFHEWRKRIKDLAYQLEFLENMEPATLKRLRKDFRRLGTLLGDDHDLIVFAEHVNQRERQYTHLATFRPVHKRLRTRLKALRAKEFALAHPLLAKKPEVWIEHLAGLWQQWKKTPPPSASGTTPPAGAPAATPV